MKKFLLLIIASCASFFCKAENFLLKQYEGLNMATKLDELIDEMSEDYEASNFDAHDALNADERRVFAKMLPKLQAKGLVSTSSSRGRGGHIQHYGQVASPDTITNLITNSVGDLNITVKRKSIAIDSTLPYILFGLQGFSSNFTSTLKSFLPSGVTATVANNSVGDMVITYVSGLNTDTVEISLAGGLISYAEFLQAMNQNYFTTKYIRYEVADDSNRLNQQSQMVNFGLLSALGAKNANQMLIRSRVMSWDYNKGITNLLLPEQKITSDFSFVQNIIKVDEYEIAWDVFMSSRVNLNKTA